MHINVLWLFLFGLSPVRLLLDVEYDERNNIYLSSRKIGKYLKLQSFEQKKRKKNDFKAGWTHKRNLGIYYISGRFYVILHLFAMEIIMNVFDTFAFKDLLLLSLWYASYFPLKQTKLKENLSFIHFLFFVKFTLLLFLQIKLSISSLWNNGIGFN